MNNYQCQCGKEFIKKHSFGVHKSQCKQYQEYIQNYLEKNYNYKCDCGKKFIEKASLKGHKPKCKTFQYLKKLEKNQLTKDLLYDLYINKEMTGLQIVNYFNFNYLCVRDIINIAQKYNIQTPTRKDAANKETTRKKYKNTCLNFYGDTNVLGKNSPIYNKKNQIVKEKYGVDNVFQLYDTKEKIKNTLIQNYGVTHPIYSPYRHKNNGKRSKPHKKVETLLENLNINYESEKIKNFKINGYNPRPDIVIEDMNIIIEINGDYWHANPKYYNKSDLIYKWDGKTRADKIWEEDKKKNNQMKSFGYKVIILWENEINNYLTKDILWKKLESNQ